MYHLFGNDGHFFPYRVSQTLSVSDNCKQSITVWFLLSPFYWHCFKAW